MQKRNLLDLTARYASALRREDYETCAAIRDEIARRFELGTLDFEMINAMFFCNATGYKPFTSFPENSAGLFGPYESQVRRVNSEKLRQTSPDAR